MEARDSVPSVRRPRPALFRVAARDPRGVREDVDSAASTDGAGWDRPPLRSPPGAAQGRVQPHGLGADAVPSFGCAVEMGRSQRAAHRTRRVTRARLVELGRADRFSVKRRRLSSLLGSHLKWPLIIVDGWRTLRSRLSGGRAWWAHFEFTRIKIEPTILRKNRGFPPAGRVRVDWGEPGR